MGCPWWIQRWKGPDIGRQESKRKGQEAGMMRTHKTDTQECEATGEKWCKREGEEGTAPHPISAFSESIWILLTMKLCGGIGEKYRKYKGRYYHYTRCWRAQAGAGGGGSTHLPPESQLMTPPKTIQLWTPAHHLALPPRETRNTRGWVRNVISASLRPAPLPTSKLLPPSQHLALPRLGSQTLLCHSEVNPQSTHHHGEGIKGTCHMQEAAAQVLFVFSSNSHKSTKSILLMKFKVMKQKKMAPRYWFWVKMF